MKNLSELILSVFFRAKREHVKTLKYEFGFNVF